MTKADTTGPAEPDAAEKASQAFYAAAEKRISRWLLLLIPVAVAAAFAVSGSHATIGVLLGSGLAFFNYSWLHRTTRRATESLAQAADSAGSSRLTGASLAFGSVARIALVTAAGYAIFRGSLQSFYGYLAGLSLPICAMCAEALYEAWHAAAHNR